MSQSISVVLPAYNEQESLEEAAQHIAGFLAGLTSKFEVIVVDDSSTDDTGRLADQLAAEHEWMKVIHNKNNLGAGGSVAVGLKAASCDIVTHNGVDLPFNMRDFSHVLSLLQHADVVIIGKRNRSSYTLYRVVTSWVNYFLVHLLFGVQFGDLNFVQVYRKAVLDAIDVESCSMFVTPEIVIKARDLGFKIVETKTDVRPRRKGKVKAGNFRDVYLTINDILRLWVKLRLGLTLGTRHKSERS